ncbi:MAG: hypothetical protein ABIL58_20365 [Pseudomonadota bacterium]
MKKNRRVQKRLSAMGAILVLLVSAAVSCVALDQSRTPEEKGIRQTDYLHSLAGVYTASLPGSPTSPGELLLALYTDGTCLFADKRFDRESAAVMTGRWDIDSHDQQVTLRLKSDKSARRMLTLAHQGPDLKVTGTDYGSDGLVLIRKDSAAR